MKPWHSQVLYRPKVSSLLARPPPQKIVCLQTGILCLGNPTYSLLWFPIIFFPVCAFTGRLWWVRPGWQRRRGHARSTLETAAMGNGQDAQASKKQISRWQESGRGSAQLRTTSREIFTKFRTRSDRSGKSVEKLRQRSETIRQRQR